MVRIAKQDRAGPVSSSGTGGMSRSWNETPPMHAGSSGPGAFPTGHCSPCRSVRASPEPRRYGTTTSWAPQVEAPPVARPRQHRGVRSGLGGQVPHPLRAGRRHGRALRGFLRRMSYAGEHRHRERRPPPPGVGSFPTRAARRGEPRHARGGRDAGGQDMSGSAVRGRSPDDGPHEDRPASSLDDTMDREELRNRYYGLLEELRTMLPGVQVLVAFLLTVPFAAKFDQLDDLGRTLFGRAILSSITSVTCMLTPTAFHRGRRTHPAVGTSALGHPGGQGRHRRPCGGAPGITHVRRPLRVRRCDSSCDDGSDGTARRHTLVGAAPEPPGSLTRPVSSRPPAGMAGTAGTLAAGRDAERRSSRCPTGTR